MPFRQTLRENPWEAFLLLWMPAMFGIISMATWQITDLWWGHTRGWIALAVLAVAYPWVRRSSGRGLLTLLWGFEIVSRLVTLPVAGIQLLTDALPDGVVFLTLPASELRGLHLAELSLSAVLHLVVLAWFMRTAAIHYGVASAFLLLGLGLADASFNIRSLMYLVVYYPGLSTIALPLLSLAVQVGVNVLMFRVLVQYRDQAPPVQLVALVIAAAYAGLLGLRILFFSLTIWPLANGIRPEGAVVFDWEFGGPWISQQVVYIALALVVGYGATRRVVRRRSTPEVAPNDG